MILLQSTLQLTVMYVLHSHCHLLPILERDVSEDNAVPSGEGCHLFLSDHRGIPSYNWREEHAGRPYPNTPTMKNPCSRGMHHVKCLTLLLRIPNYSLIS
jgi:hypothetical protein